ncbi:MAG: putative aminopeptidase [Bryobacterales bacterium]|nr:putative aminopeptidase [Bryobacterales bacterium]
MAGRIPRQSVATAAVLLLALLATAADQPLAPDQRAVMDHISADSLRGHLSFLSSDLLEGRATPSRGLDLAAEYLAAQFRRAGLEPAGDDGYFQTATVTVREPNREGFSMTVSAGGRTMTVAPEEAYILPVAPLRVDDAELVIADGSQPLKADAINGKAVIAMQRVRLPQGARPALMLTLAPALPMAPQVANPEGPAQPVTTGVIAKPGLADFVRGATDARITLHGKAAYEKPVKVRNVAAILRGSDPQLRDTYVMLSAHYDHLGIASAGEDRIYNGANDDGSGTSSVVEIASALAALPAHPKRSVLFVMFFGEERGLWGSRYYATHPLVPLAQTIASLNLEQIGRTDDADGPQIKSASVTGYDYSELPAIVADAAQPAGVKVYKNPKNSDAYFSRSDNQSLADLGIPAHTLCVAYDFPDYHKVSDSWDKIDYDNMAAVDRAVALGMMRLASDAPPPKWYQQYSPAQRYV